MANFSDVLHKWQSLRPSPDRNLDQFWATEETVKKRVAYIGGLINDRTEKILFLGDDDLTSVALCMSRSSLKATVVDIDKRILEFIGRIAESEGLLIETYYHDLRNPLPKDLFNDYDLIFYDPPYTTQGIGAWLARSIEASLSGGKNADRKSLDRLSRKKYVMCYGYTDRGVERGYAIQKIITDFGLVIQEKRKNFNEYYEAKAINSLSDLYLLSPTPHVNIRKIDGERSRFYTGQRKSAR
ncbi:MAG: bis-aminopropyl spermidine synthase family protein [Patescibacteria group bacterium]|jgi:predicted methyltransferase